MPAREFSVSEMARRPPRTPSPAAPPKPKPKPAPKSPRRRWRKTWLWTLLAFAAVTAGYLAYEYWRLHRYDGLIAKVAASYGFDAQLIRAVVHEESYFNPRARSHANAVGLMQITPIVITEWTNVTGRDADPRGFSKAWASRAPDLSPTEAAKLSDAELLMVPEINLHMGCWYLSQLRRRFSDESLRLPMMLAGYNAGPSQAERWRATGRPLPAAMAEEAYLRAIDYPETQGYVRRILARYRENERSEP